MQRAEVGVRFDERGSKLERGKRRLTVQPEQNKRMEWGGSGDKGNCLTGNKKKRDGGKEDGRWELKSG